MEASNGESVPTQSAESHEERKTITVQVLTPSPEVPGGRVILTDIPISTTLAQLRARISQEVASSPSPDRQRLIYRGRPLNDNLLTVHEVFSAELASATPPDVFTIHLVMPPPTYQPNNQTPASSTGPQQPSGPQNAPNQHPNGGLPVQLLQSMQAQMMQQMQQLHQIQQMRHTHHIPQLPFMPPPGGPGVPTVPALPSFPNTQNLMQQMPQGLNVHHGPPMPQAPAGGAPFPHGSTNGLNHWPTNVPQAPNMNPSQVPQVPNPESWPTFPTHNHPITGPGRATVPAQSNEPSRVDSPRINSSHGHDGIQPPSGTSEHSLPNNHLAGSQFPQPAGSMSVHESMGPNGQRYRTVVGQTINVVQTPRPGSAPPSHGGGSGNTVPSQNGANPGLPPMSTRPPVQGFWPHLNAGQLPLDPRTPFTPPPPMNSLRSMHDLMSSMGQGNVNGGNAPTTAWLLSSPTGPQGFLFSPNHGLFSTSTVSNTNPRAAAMRPFMSGSRLIRHAETRNGNRNRQGEAAPVVQAALAQPRERQPPGNQDGDLLRGLLRRAWIFMRFYLLALFFSEYGTWRRWILLGIAVIACLLPETALFRDVGQRVQRHIENLVPLAPRRGQGERENQPAAAGGGRNGGPPQEQRARRQEPTPEQTAERLRNEHHQRQTAWWREGLSRAERAVALFVATLFPGVGERHIQARNDAEAERRAELQRRLEAEQNAARNDDLNGENPQPTEAGSNDDATAQSSAVEGHDGGETPRYRNNNEAGPAPVEVEI